MNSTSIEARLFALESVIKVLMLTHQNPQEAMFKFGQIYMETVRTLNKDGSPEKAEVAKELVTVCNMLSPYFPKT